MNRADRRAHARAANAEIRLGNARMGLTETLRLMTDAELARAGRDRPKGCTKVWRSTQFLVQEYEPERHVADIVVCRLSVNRVEVRADGDRWTDGITWDDLQRIKRECGYGNHDAVEVYPVDADVVNVANLRHLFVLAAPLPFAWRSA